MPVHLERDVIPVPGPGAAGDFWRTPTTAGALPDGTNDVTEDVARTGNTGIGVFTIAPVAKLDVAVGGRAGTDGRVANVTPFYVTSNNMPGLNGTIATVPATPTGGAEFRHSNQSQGIGIGFDSIYCTGSNADQAFNFINRGSGQISFYQQTLLGGFNYFNHMSSAIAANQGWQERYWANGVQEHVKIMRRSTIGVGGTSGFEIFWQMREANGTFRNAMVLRPSVTNANTFSLNIDENLLNDAKLVLFGSAATAFFGFGVKSATLASFVSSNGGHFRWYQGTSPGTQVMGLSGVGNLTIDPLGVGGAGFTSPVIRFGSETSVEGIHSQRTGADRFTSDLELHTAGIRRLAVLNNGRIYMQNVPTFATDALAGAGGLATGEVYKDALGALRIKL